MSQNTNNLTALFKDNISEFCSLQEALYYILLGIVPFGDNETFQQNINNALILKHNFLNNPYLQDSNLDTNSGTIKSDISDSVITEYDKYCIELEKLCQSASNDLRELLLNGTIKTYHAESKNLIPKVKLQDLKVNFKYWEGDENIVINFKDLLKFFPIEKIHKPKHYKIINNGVQLIILDNITLKRKKSTTRQHSDKISSVAKHHIIKPMFLQLYTGVEKTSKIAKEIHIKLHKLDLKIIDINNRFTASHNPIKDKNDLIENFAKEHKLKRQYLNRVITEYFNYGRLARIRTWCKEFAKIEK
jgi:hypothetical protein